MNAKPDVTRRRVAGGLGLALAAAAVLFGCRDAAQPPGPGTVTATLVSPNGAEGAAVFSVFGDGVGDIGGDAGRVWSLRHGDTVRVVVVRQDSGSISLHVAMADSTQRPGVVVVQVAGPDDMLRQGLGGYTVRFNR